jgi:hypothetical protein
MAEKLTRLTQIQLHLVAENYTIRSSRYRRPVRKLLDTPSYCGSGGIADALASAASRPGHFTSEITVPGIQWIGGSVGPRAGLDAVEKRKITSLPPPGVEPRSPSQ